MTKDVPAPGSVSIYTLMARLFAETAKEVIETFGPEIFESEPLVLEAFVAEAGITI